MRQRFFDEVVWPKELDQGIAVVVHRNAMGRIYAFHSLLEEGPVRCDICEAPGNRVYLTHLGDGEAEHG